MGRERDMLRRKSDELETAQRLLLDEHETLKVLVLITTGGSALHQHVPPHVPLPCPDYYWSRPCYYWSRPYYYCDELETAQRLLLDEHETLKVNLFLLSYSQA